ncbi:MAG: hypothetical protein QW429_05610 [Thermoprotei archaeon]
MGVEFSVSFTGPASASPSNPGTVTVNLPVSKWTLLGTVTIGPAIGIQFTPGMVAIVSPTPMIGPEPVQPYFPVTYDGSGNQLNVLTYSNSQLGFLYFGSKPSNSSRPYRNLVDFLGSIGQIGLSNSGSSAANVSGTLTLSFSAGNITLTGLVVLRLDASSAYDVVTFNTAAGKSITAFGVDMVANTADNIIPLNAPNSGQTLSLGVTAISVTAGATHTVGVIIYYKV